ncbi:hypothetical protein BH11BAC3_BH11BAC3_40600 [soil metagenome]
MKYYLVNYLVFTNSKITEDCTTAVSIPMDIYDCTSSFKNQISKQKMLRKDDQSVVIKTYKQISEDIFILVHPFVKENKVEAPQDIETLNISYQFCATNYSK